MCAEKLMHTVWQRSPLDRSTVLYCFLLRKWASNLISAMVLHINIVQYHVGWILRFFSVVYLQFTNVGVFETFYAFL